MGKPMIRKLLDGGFTVRVFDVHKHMAESVIAAGAIWTTSSRECAIGAGIVCTCLPLPVHVRQQMVGANGALAGMTKGATWIDTSTTDYHNTLDIAAMARSLGCYSLEAPVSNLSHMGVDFCNTSYLVGGDEEAWKAAQAFLDVTGKISFFIGKIGMAQSAKLLTNDTFYTAVIHFGEVCALVQEAHIPLHWFWDFIKESRGNTVASDQFAPFLFDGSWDDSCILLIGVKDMQLTCEMADEVSEGLPVSRITNEAYQLASQRYDVNRGHVQVSRITEDDNEVTLRIPNFSAPSKYGVDKSYEHPTGMIRDAIGREKPELGTKYRSPPVDVSKEQREMARDLCEYLALINLVVFEEAVRLGVGMGVEEDLVKKILTWSVGTCWVQDHLDEYLAEQKFLDKVKDIVSKSNLRLRWFHEVEPVLRRRFGWSSL